MRLHETIDELWRDALEDIVQNGAIGGTRTGCTKSTFGWSGMLIDCGPNLLRSPARKLPYHRVMAYLLWNLSGCNDVAMIAKYWPRWKKLSNDGKAFGQYGARMRLDAWNMSPVREHLLVSRILEHKDNQLDSVICALKNDNTSRRATISLWSPSDLVAGILEEVNSLPSAVALHFEVREGALCCAAFMRSNDVWEDMPYDVFLFTTIQRIIASELGLKRGEYMHTVGNLYIATKRAEQARQAMLWHQQRHVADDIIAEHREDMLQLDDIKAAIEGEKAFASLMEADDFCYDLVTSYDKWLQDNLRNMRLGLAAEALAACTFWQALREIAQWGPGDREIAFEGLSKSYLKLSPKTNVPDAVVVSAKAWLVKKGIAL